MILEHGGGLRVIRLKSATALNRLYDERDLVRPESNCLELRFRTPRACIIRPTTISQRILRRRGDLLTVRMRQRVKRAGIASKYRRRWFSRWTPK